MSFPKLHTITLQKTASGPWTEIHPRHERRVPSFMTLHKGHVGVFTKFSNQIFVNKANFKGIITFESPILVEISLCIIIHGLFFANTWRGTALILPFACLNVIMHDLIRDVLDSYQYLLLY